MGILSGIPAVNPSGNLLGIPPSSILLGISLGIPSEIFFREFSKISKRTAFKILLGISESFRDVVGDFCQDFFRSHPVMISSRIDSGNPLRISSLILPRFLRESCRNYFRDFLRTFLEIPIWIFPEISSEILRGMLSWIISEIPLEFHGFLPRFLLDFFGDSL